MVDCGWPRHACRSPVWSIKVLAVRDTWFVVAAIYVTAIKGSIQTVVLARFKTGRKRTHPAWATVNVSDTCCLTGDESPVHATELVDRAEPALNAFGIVVPMLPSGVLAEPRYSTVKPISAPVSVSELVLAIYMTAVREPAAHHW